MFLGYYLLILFGFVLLFPALLVPSQKPPQRPAEKRNEPPSRPSPPPQPMEVPPSPAPVMTTQTQYMSMSAQPSASSPLFPTALFPSLSLPLPQAKPSSEAKPASEAKQAPVEQRDEVLEYGLLLAILKMVFG